MRTLLLLGATGLVGRASLELALADPGIECVIAPTRRALSPHPKLINPVLDFEHLEDRLPDQPIDAVVCALGTTIRDAGSREAFRRVDHDFPLRFARYARQHGARSFALTSAMGADRRSPIFYSRTKGELEHALRAMAFESLTLVRPGLLGGSRERRRPMEQAAQRVLGAVGRWLPPRWRMVPASAVAATLLDAAHEAIPGVHVIESARIGSKHRRAR